MFVSVWTSRLRQDIDDDFSSPLPVLCTIKEEKQAYMSFDFVFWFFSALRNCSTRFRSLVYLHLHYMHYDGHISEYLFWH